MKKINSSQKGSIMIEALAMLGLIAMVTPVLYRKAAERTTELQDINVASQIRMVSQAVDSYLKDNYTNLASMSNTTVIDSESDHFAKIQAYLPEGFDLNQASKLFEDFKIAVKKESLTDLQGNQHNVFTSAVVAALHDDMTRGRAAKIATMIGTNGGMITKDAGGYHFNGTQGSWSTTPEQFGFAWDEEHPVRDNSLVSISTEAISSAIGDVDSSEALYRIWTGDADKNTMKTPLIFGNNSLLNMQGHDIQGVSNIIANSGMVTVSGALTVDDLTVHGILSATTFSGNFIGGSISGDSLTINGTSTLNGITNTGTISSTGDITAPVFHGKLQGDVEGGTISGNSLTINGDSTLKGNLEVTGTSTLNGDLNMKNHNITNVGDITANNFHGNVIGGSISGDSLTINGDSTLKGDLEVTGDAIINGKTITSALEVTNGDLNMNNHDITNVNNITATIGDFNNLHARTKLTVGGDNLGEGTMLEVSNSGTVVKTTNFSVDDNKIVVNSGTTYIGRGYNDTSFAGLTMGDDYADLSSGTASSISLRDDKIILNDNNTDSGVAIDGEGLVVGNKIGGAQPSAYTDFSGPQLGSVSDVSANVLISRNGVIELASPTDENNGFIRARRLVSDQKYVFHGLQGNKPGGAISYTGGAPDKTYDYYQVNPAYTSVMNDIKLATRGGARLSDILPDYINKGIYVADNTISDLDLDWTATEANDFPKVLAIGSPADCGNDANCVTSPWLGFVPAPQCPPAYDTVITIEPFRWRMSEIYDVRNLIGTSSDTTLKKIFPIHGSGNSTASGTESFDYYFDRYENPLRPNGYDSEYAVTISGNTASVTNAPLLFQTNTWLNTSMAEHSNGDQIKGWSVLMGFLYPVTNPGNNSPYTDNNYLALYNRIKTSTDPDVASSSVIWNLFPVRNQEMAAIVRLYCSFNRLDEEYNWIWKDTKEVYKYDQLHSLGTSASQHKDFWDKDMYEKDDVWSKAVNDPQLGYDDAW